MNPNALMGEIVAATLKHQTKDINDNVSQHNALWNRIKSRGGIVTVSGGRSLVHNLEYAENTTYQRYSGYDVLNINPQEVFDAAEYPWRQIAIHVTIDGRTIRMNRGKEAMINLAKDRVKNAMKSFSNGVNRDMYSLGTLPNQIGGLQLLISDNPENIVGGIDGAEWAFWRNKTLNLRTPPGGGAAIALSKDNIRSVMNKMFISLTRGNDKPDFILTCPDWYEMYMESLQWQQQYTDTQSASSGFTSLKYQNADIFFDQTISEVDGTTPIMPDKHMYFINTDYLKLHVHKDANMTPLEDKVSVNQDATISPVIWMGNLTTSNRARQGVIYDAA